MGGLGALIMAMLETHLHRLTLSVSHGIYIAVDRHKGNYVLVKREDLS